MMIDVSTLAPRLMGEVLRAMVFEPGKGMRRGFRDMDLVEDPGAAAILRLLTGCGDADAALKRLVEREEHVDIRSNGKGLEVGRLTGDGYEDIVFVVDRRFAVISERPEHDGAWAVEPLLEGFVADLPPWKAFAPKFVAEAVGHPAAGRFNAAMIALTVARRLEKFTRLAREQASDEVVAAVTRAAIDRDPHLLPEILAPLRRELESCVAKYSRAKDVPAMRHALALIAAACGAPSPDARSWNEVIQQEIAPVVA